MRFRLFIMFIFAAFIAWSGVNTARGQSSDIEDMANKARERADSIDVSALIENSRVRLEEGRDRVSEMNVTAQSANSAAVEEILNLDLDELVPDNEKEVSGLYIFISFSMPDNLIKQYIHDASQYGGYVMIGGLHKDSFSETIKKVSQFVETRDGQGVGGVMIDPKSFETFSVRSVPTIILAKQELVPCLDAACERDIPMHDRISGSISIEHALIRFSKEGDLRWSANQRIKYGDKSFIRSALNE